MFLSSMPSPPAPATPILRAGASAGAALAAAGVAAVPFERLGATHALATGVVALSAVLLHVRHTAVQVSARAIWLTAGILGATNLLLGPSRERVASALVVAGVALAAGTLGRFGLGRGERGAFEPAAFRAPLLLTLALSTANLLGLTFYGVGILEAWGLVTENLIFASGLGLGLFGLWRMRTWGLLVLGAMHGWIASVELVGHPSVPLVMKGVYGITSLAALVGLAPLLGLFVKRALRDEPAPAARVRVAELESRVAPCAEIAREHAAEIEADAQATRPVRGAA